MRFFACNPADADRTGNLPPGTVVEKGVTHPYAFDFYRMLVLSHSCEDKLMDSPGSCWSAGNC
jgi:hypothetical protein